MSSDGGGSSHAHPRVPGSAFETETASSQWTLVPPRWQEILQSVSGSHLPKLLLLVLLLAGVIAGSQLLDITALEALVAYLQQDLWRGGALFVAFNTAAQAVLFPSALLSLTAGGIFGLVAGGILACIGTILGQTLAFLIGRFLLRDMVTDYMTLHWPRWAAVDAAVSREGWKLITLLRLSPAVPWNVLNFALSVTGVGFWTFAVSSAGAIVPWTVTLAYFGSLAKSIADIANGAAYPEGAASYAIFLVSGTLMVVTAGYTTYVSRRALSKHLADTGETGQDIVEELDRAALLSPRLGLGSPLGSSDRLWCPPLGSSRGSQPLDSRAAGDGWKSPPSRRSVQRPSTDERGDV